MKQMSSFVLTNDSFELLILLINLVLNEMDASPSRYFITAKKIIKVASTICRKENKNTEFIKDFIREHKIFRDLDFWQEQLFDELFSKQKQYFPDQQTVDRDFLSTLCCSFALNMEINWLVPTNMVDEFLRNITHSRTLGLEDEPRKALESDIHNFMSTGRRKGTVAETAIEPKKSN